MKNAPLEVEVVVTYCVLEENEDVKLLTLPDQAEEKTLSTLSTVSVLLNLIYVVVLAEFAIINYLLV
tara:strand:+ start:2356 stop:2556 length:201 start_codon:yes stop_codon:yes gene_type:complete